MFDVHEKKQNDWLAVQKDQQERLEAMRVPFGETQEKLRAQAKAEGMSYNRACIVSRDFVMYT